MRGRRAGSGRPRSLATWATPTAPYTPAMTDLFADAASTHASQTAPLPQRIRPRSLDELVGQRHVLAEGSALRLAIEADRPPSMILYGPPGVGKTTLARIVAETTGAAFEELSAVSARVDDVRGVLQRARDRIGANGTRTILFLDEIHRFNKGQQDALLPGVESGLLTLIGATTENPYFEVNAALLSRCAVIELEPLSDDEVAAVVAAGRRRARDRRAAPRSSSDRAARPAAMRAARSPRSSSRRRRPRPRARRSRCATSPTPPASARSATTATETSTTTSSRRSSSR